jgi:protein SCO1/2
MPAAQLLPADGSTLRSAAGRLAADATLRGRVKLVTLSFDPDFDTPAVLAAHAGETPGRSRRLDVPDRRSSYVDKFAARLGVGINRPAGVPELTHNLRTALVGADGRIVKITPATNGHPQRRSTTFAICCAGRDPVAATPERVHRA